MSHHHHYYHPRSNGYYYSSSTSDTTTDSDSGELTGNWVWNGRTWQWVRQHYHSRASTSDCSTSSEEEGDSVTPNAYVVIVLDWDDTLFPTTDLERYTDVSRIDRNSARQALGGRILRDLAALDARVVALLRQCAEFGTVKIVTDAYEGWVQHTAYHLLPGVYRFMHAQGVETISSRELHQHRFRDSWARKQKVFKDELRGALNGYRPRPDTFAFVSIGDDESERAAALSLRGSLPKECLKVVKLVDYPTLEKTIEQVACMEDSIYSIVASNYHIDADCDHFARGRRYRR